MLILLSLSLSLSRSTNGYVEGGRIGDAGEGGNAAARVVVVVVFPELREGCRICV